MNATSKAIHSYLESVTPAVPRATRDELREYAIRLTAVVNMYIGGASPLQPLTLTAPMVNHLQAIAASLEFALAHEGQS